jgi:hypothetical protein
VHGTCSTDLQPAAATRRGVPGDQLVLDGDLEDLGEAGERLVDRPRTDPAFAHFVLPVAVDLLNRDLVQAMLGEERQQVDGQLLLVRRDGRRTKLGLLLFEPL